MLKNSKGELTTQQIVLLIILITSFVVILFFFFRLNLGEETQKEICHNSVILKSKTSLGGELDCRTNYLCISSDGSKECDGISATETVPINSDEKEAKKKEIMSALANEMSDCWWQFGEEKLDYAGGWDITQNTACSVCSIVDFDSDILEEKITYRDFYEYLKTEKKSMSQTYLNYLYGVSSLEGFKGNYLNNEFDLSKEYFVLTALREKGEVYEKVEPAASFLWEVTFDLGILGFLDIVSSSKDENGKNIKLESMPVVILERNKENFDTLKCDEFVTKS